MVMVLEPQLENGASDGVFAWMFLIDLAKVITVGMVLVPQLENGASGGGVRMDVSDRSGEGGHSGDGLGAVT